MEGAAHYPHEGLDLKQGKALKLWVKGSTLEGRFASCGDQVAREEEARNAVPAPSFARFRVSIPEILRLTAPI